MWLQPQTNVYLSEYFTRKGMHEYPVHLPSLKLEMHPNKISPNCCANMFLATEFSMLASAHIFYLQQSHKSVSTCFPGS